MNRKIFILTTDFYSDNNFLKEIMQKKDRPYFMYNLNVNGIDFALPFRSNISHKYYFSTGNSKKDKVGIDYTKAVIISDKDKYLEKTLVKIRKEEYKNMIGKEHIILKEFLKYIKIYKKAYKITSQNKGTEYEKNLCTTSTLQNYHKELNIGKF